MDEEFIPSLLQVIEMGMPLTTIANAMRLIEPLWKVCIALM